MFEIVKAFLVLHSSEIITCVLTLFLAALKKRADTAEIKNKLASKGVSETDIVYAFSKNGQSKSKDEPTADSSEKV